MAFHSMHCYPLCQNVCKLIGKIKPKIQNEPRIMHRSCLNVWLCLYLCVCAFIFVYILDIYVVLCCSVSVCAHCCSWFFFGIANKQTIFQQQFVMFCFFFAFQFHMKNQKREKLSLCENHAINRHFNAYSSVFKQCSGIWLHFAFQSCFKWAYFVFFSFFFWFCLICGQKHKTVFNKLLLTCCHIALWTPN